MLTTIRAIACALACVLAGVASAVPGGPLKPGSGWLVQGGAYPSTLWKTPVRVLLAGDSLMESLGPQMRNSLSGYSNITFIPIGKKSTGLSRPDFYDWPTVLRKNLTEHRPHLVVMWVGTNDPQGIHGHRGLGEPCSEAWQEVYRTKLHEVVQLSHAHGARFMLMGPPVVGDPKLNAQLGIIDHLMQLECRSLGICYISTRYILGGKEGLFHPRGRLLSGEYVDLRSSDRVHITSDGNRRVMDYLLPYLAREIERCFRTTSSSRRAARRVSGSATIIRPKGQSTNNE